MKLGLCSARVGGEVSEVYSHALGDDAAMAVLIAQHDPFVLLAPEALHAVLGERWGMYFDEPSYLAPYATKYQAYAEVR